MKKSLILHSLVLCARKMTASNQAVSPLKLLCTDPSPSNITPLSWEVAQNKLSHMAKLITVLSATLTPSVWQWLATRIVQYLLVSKMHYNCFITRISIIKLAAESLTSGIILYFLASKMSFFTTVPSVGFIINMAAEPLTLGDHTLFAGIKETPFPQNATKNIVCVLHTEHWMTRRCHLNLYECKDQITCYYW